MLTNRTLFREYILLRARMVAYVSGFLALVCLLAFAILLAGDGRSVYRFGLFLQMAGVLAVALDLLDVKRFPSRFSMAEANRYRNIPKAAGLPNATSNPGSAELPGKLYFAYYLKRNQPVVWGNLVASVILIWALGVSALARPGEQFAWEPIILLGAAVLGFAWINLFLLVHIHLMVQSQVPAGLMSWFFSVDLPVSFIGLPFAGLMHIVLRWLPWLHDFIFQNNIKRVLILVTLPCFLVGLALQLMSTFLPGSPANTPVEISLLLRLWAIIRSTIG